MRSIIQMYKKTKTLFLHPKNPIQIFMILIIGLMVVSGCAQYTGIEVDTQKALTLSKTLSDIPEVKKFESVEEIEEFLERARSYSGSYGAPIRFFEGDMVDMAMVSAVPTLGAAESSGSSKSATDFSTTNVQVEGVDEADFVKNDGRYIYMVHDEDLLIVDAFDAENADIVSTITIDDSDNWRRARATQLFVSGDKLVLFVQDYEDAITFRKYDIEPVRTSNSVLKVRIYDITDRKNPELEETVELTGEYFQSRMIGNIVYVVAQEGVGYGPIIMPEVSVRGSIIHPDVFYFDNPEDSYNFNTIASIDISSGEVVDAETFMLGYGDTLMVSENNIYMAYKRNRWRSDYEKDRFTEVILPMLPSELMNEINAIRAEGLKENAEWNKISDALAAYFSDVEEYQELLEDLADALEEYDVKKELERSKTIIHKIGIDKGDLNYVAAGEVFGSLLNQFSMDENEGKLRVSTTTSIWAKRRIQHNNVFVLDSSMDVVGKLIGIAEDERIFSARFMGDRLYMTTFRQTDPFFVIDLSTDDPKILGELKIPGFSDYLHPFDENHIIGVGKETEETKFGFNTGGVKIALFDVSDVSNPKEVDHVEIGDRGSDTPITRDHKAFLFDPERNMLVIPVAEITKREKVSDYLYSHKIWHGAYVFELDENGFEELGKIEHDSVRSDYFNWWNLATVQRSLYMDDNLYTISDKFIKINDIENELGELGSVRLPRTREEYPII